MNQNEPIDTGSRVVRAYIRSSADELAVQRVRTALGRFMGEHGSSVLDCYIEGQCGTHLGHPRLFQLLDDSRSCDVVLVNDVNVELSLTGQEWKAFKTILLERSLQLLVVNIPATWLHLRLTDSDADRRTAAALTAMLLETLDVVRQDGNQKRQHLREEGVSKAKREGKYTGRKPDLTRYEAINTLLTSGQSWSAVQRTLGCSRGTISSAVKYGTSTVGGLEVVEPSSAEFSVMYSEQPGKSVTVLLWFNVENGSQFTRGKTQVKRDIDDTITVGYGLYCGTKLPDGDYRIEFRYDDDEDLKDQIADLIDEIHYVARGRNCVVSYVKIKQEGTERYWRDYEGGWEDD